MCVRTSGSSTGSVPSTSACMSTIRPRGLSFSSSSVRYVGHACRQKPQCTHASMPALASASGVPGMAQGAALRVGGRHAAGPRMPGFSTRSGSNVRWTPLDSGSPTADGDVRPQRLRAAARRRAIPVHAAPSLYRGVARSPRSSRAAGRMHRTTPRAIVAWLAPPCSRDDARRPAPRARPARRAGAEPDDRRARRLGRAQADPTLAESTSRVVPSSATARSAARTSGSLPPSRTRSSVRRSRPRRSDIVAEHSSAASGAIWRRAQPARRVVARALVRAVDRDGERSIHLRARAQPDGHLGDRRRACPTRRS